MSDSKPSASGVGYGNPPESTRFKSGESGNKKGRPKGVRTLSADLRAELATLVKVTEDNREVEITRQRLLAKRIVRHACNGDRVATKIVLDLFAREVEAKPSNSEDDEILREYVDDQLKARMAQDERET